MILRLLTPSASPSTNTTKSSLSALGVFMRALLIIAVNLFCLSLTAQAQKNIYDWLKLKDFQSADFFETVDDIYLQYLSIDSELKAHLSIGDDVRHGEVSCLDTQRSQFMLTTIVDSNKPCPECDSEEVDGEIQQSLSQTGHRLPLNQIKIGEVVYIKTADHNLNHSSALVD